MLIDQIKRLASRHHKDTVALRRHLHQNPELSFQETQTGRFIAQKLTEYGIAHRYGIAENGVVAHIKGHNSNASVVALRADIDALPIQEANEVEYKSQNDGVMHACGHDVHTSSLLATARILNELKSEFSGTVKLIFQPAEEKLPGGASIMIKEGVLKDPSPRSIIGQHVHPPLEIGKVGLKPGVFMASADEIYMTVKGRGGHGAIPQDCIDPILISAHIITALQQLVSRRSNPTIPSVLTIGKINSTGGSTNIIPNEVKLMGTLRTLDENWRFEAHRIMKNMAVQMAESMGGSCDFDVVVGYPFLHNDVPLTLRTKQAAIDYLGVENVVDLPVRMSAEDFAYYSQEMPACFYRLGTGNPSRGITSPVHTNTFDVDEDCLELGPGLMAWMAIQELKAGDS